jgi:DmsE family decaheme c-type cytochrome
MRRRGVVPLASFLLVWLVIAFVPVAGSPQSQESSDKKKPMKQEGALYQRPTDPSLYVGSETCKQCHEDLYKNFETTPHFATTMEGKLEAHQGVDWQGCEACHGPGKEHVDGGGDKTKIFTFKNASAAETSARCLGCHEYGEEHSNFARSAHLLNNVGCIDCHSPHHAKESEFLMRESTPGLCYKCHLEVKAQFAKPFHHRVNEGLVHCYDCHNPHGGFQQRQLRVSSGQSQACFKCHADKAGPWVYQHEALIEGCAICHSPHGSSNPRLLKQNQVNLLCLECHAFQADVGPAATPTFHNQAQKYQACTLCHVAIHGSNTSSVFFTP